MTFLNKKQQVFDFQLTPYGKHKLSKGSFEPEYYAFFDDNVIYDKKYVSVSSDESQNSIHDRIKNQTPYISTQTRFSEALSGSVTAGGSIDAMFPQDENIFTSQGFIGDALLLAEQSDLAPGWKTVSLSNEIKSTATEDIVNKNKISQIHITASYNLSIFDPTQEVPSSFKDFLEVGAMQTTPPFSDGLAIKLEMNNPLLFVEELNTEFLNKNFDVEIYEVTREGTEDLFRQLYFDKKPEQIVNGLLVSNTTQKEIMHTTSSVEYYFSLLKDSDIDDITACKYIEQYSLDSLLIDLDFDCSGVKPEDVFFDIYGAEVGDPEVC